MSSLNELSLENDQYSVQYSSMSYVIINQQFALCANLCINQYCCKNSICTAMGILMGTALMPPRSWSTHKLCSW